jgi:peptidoglycan hydrolase CwlO-like protein
MAPSAPAGWPRAAKILIAVLAVLALVGAAGTIIGFTSGDDASDAELADMTAERDDLADEVTTLTERTTTAEQARTDLEADVADLTTERDQLESDLTELTVERDELATIAAGGDEALADLIASRDALQVQVDGYETTIADLRAELAELDSEGDGGLADVIAERDALADRVASVESTLADIRVELADVEADLDAVEAERDAFADLFPMTFDAALDMSELADDYDIDWTQVYCAGFPTCGTVPADDELVIGTTSAGFLDLDIEGFFEAGLFRIDGALFAVGETTEAVAACGTTPRRATVAVTLFANGMTIADDGTNQVDDLAAAVLVQADAVGTCPAGLAFYGAEVVPQA